MPRPDIRTLRGEAAHEWLLQLSRDHSTVVGLKNTENALSGRGDLDLSAAANDWDRAIETATEVVWELTCNAVVGVSCSHVPSVRISLWHPGQGADLLQLDLSDALVTRGLTWASPQSLLGVSTMDPRGFRLAPPAVQAFVGLVTKEAGRAHAAADAYATKLRREVKALGREAVNGMVTPLFDAEVMRRAAAELVRTVDVGAPWRGSFERFAFRAQVLAFRDPRYAASRWRFRHRGTCSAASTVISGRRCTPERLREIGLERGHRLTAGR